MYAQDVDYVQVTGTDTTPYAMVGKGGMARWWRMATWVYFATWGRIRHLALIRASDSSRRFARISVLLLAATLALIESTHQGWHLVAESASQGTAEPVKPSGRGWLHVVAVPYELVNRGNGEGYVDLWWNIAHTVTALAIGMVAGLVLVNAGLLLLRLGTGWAHAPSYRDDRRMTAAIDYSTGWCVPVVAGGILAALRPIEFASKVSAWPWVPPAYAFYVPAAVLAGIGAVMWWFLLVRLAVSAPAATRARVVTFLALGPPVLVAAGAAAWLRLTEPMYAVLFEHMGVDF